MSTLSIFSTAWRRYLWFILWGLVNGAVAYLVISYYGGGSYRGNIALAAACIVSGGMISAVVFGILLRLPQGLRAAGFLLVGILTPWLAMVLGHTLYCGCLELIPDPLAVFVILLWTVFYLPFSVLSAAAYFFIWLLSRSQAKARSPSVSG